MTDKNKIQTELDFLAELERGEVTSQLSLSQRISVSVGFVNALLKRAVQKGFVKVSTAPRRRYAYYITPQGFQEKSRLVAEYLESSLQFYRKARREYLDLLRDAKDEAISHAQGQASSPIAFVGAGELTEIALLAARELDIEPVGIVDPNNISDHHLGLRIVPKCEDFPANTIFIITDSQEPQAAYETACRDIDAARVLSPQFLRIVQLEMDQDNRSEAAE